MWRSERGLVRMDDLLYGVVRSAINDHFVIRRIIRAAVVAWLKRQPLDVLAVNVHRIQLEVAVTLAGEDDLLAVRAYGGLGVIAGRVGQIFYIPAVHRRRINVVIPVDRPDIAF